jgi:hypothetical protein
VAAAAAAGEWPDAGSAAFNNAAAEIPAKGSRNAETVKGKEPGTTGDSKSESSGVETMVGAREGKGPPWPEDNRLPGKIAATASPAATADADENEDDNELSGSALRLSA